MHCCERKRDSETNQGWQRASLVRFIFQPHLYEIVTDLRVGRTADKETLAFLVCV